MSDMQITFITIASFGLGCLLLAGIAAASDLIGEPLYYRIIVRDGKYFVRGSRFRILWRVIEDGNAEPSSTADDAVGGYFYYKSMDDAFECIANRKRLLEAKKAKPEYEVVRDLDIRNPFTKDHNGTESR